MSESIQFNSRVGDDGVLNVQLNLGGAVARREVVVTIQPVDPTDTSEAASLSWPEFIDRTYGSCAGRGLDRHDQGQFEQREPIA
jgi:hypothetical protein